MSTRCKPGDICIVIQGPSTGKVVRVMRAASHEEVRKSLNEHAGTHGQWNILVGHYWRLDLPVAFVDLSRTHGDTYIAYEIDDWLLPITPDSELKAQELKEKMQ